MRAQLRAARRARRSGRPARARSRDPGFAGVGGRRRRLHHQRGAARDHPPVPARAGQPRPVHLRAARRSSPATTRATPAALAQQSDVFTWAILKAHTVNRAGSVLLRSADPRDTPDVRFRYFEEGDDAAGRGPRRGGHRHRGGRARSCAGLEDDVAAELVPGAEVTTREELRPFVRDNAWGHHASCTCAIGARLRPARRARQRLPRARHPGAAGGRRVGLPAHPRLLHRHRDLHGRARRPAP